MNTSLYRFFRILSLVIFPIILVIFVYLYFNDLPAYQDSLREFGVGEWLTAEAFIAAGLVGLAVGMIRWNRTGFFQWYYFGLAALFVFFALEEISYGQWIFELEVNEIFLERSESEEINLHNLMQGETDIDIKDLGAVMFIGLGLVLPLADKYSDKAHNLFEKLHIVPPDISLSAAFVVAVIIMMVDQPTRDEEELAEMMLAIACLLMFLMHLVIELNDFPRIESAFIPDNIFNTILRSPLTMVVIILVGLVASSRYDAIKTEQFRAQFAVVPLGEPDNTAIREAVRGPNNEVACGVFDVGGHGQRVAILTDFPACDPDLPFDVYCLNGEGQWFNDNISEVQENGLYTTTQVSFTSAQDGVCGLLQPAN